LHCNYFLDGRRFAEVVQVGPGYEWGPAAKEAARLVHLLAGVSYYKAGAPPVIDVGATELRPGEREFLRHYYIEGLGEFAFRNGLSLEDLQVVGGAEAGLPNPAKMCPESLLVPFGGGIDSVVTVGAVREVSPGTALFVVSPHGAPRFEAIERAVEAVGLPVVRAEREVDRELSAQPGQVFNGHVPVTAIVSAIAVLCAVLTGRGRVVMSNEWSASRGNLVSGERAVNHQYSKSADFEDRFRAVLAAAFAQTVDYFSFLRPFSELWVARRFANMERFHPVVHSCNRAFYLDPAKRLDHWCGRCDKCCFIDLILSPFMSRQALGGIFDGSEPLDDPTLLQSFRTLLALGEAAKPFECVGDPDECRSAAALAAARPDRAGSPVLQALVSELAGSAGSARAAASKLFQPLASHNVPNGLLTAALG